MTPDRTLLLQTPEALGATLLTQESVRRGVRPTGEPVRVFLLDDQPLMREALKALLGADPKLVLVGDSADATECARLASRLAAQVVLINADIGGDACASLVRELRVSAVGARIIAFGRDDRPQFILELFQAGAYGFLPRTVTLDELHDAVDTVAGGGTYLPPSTAKALASGIRSTPVTHSASQATDVLKKLSKRERTVFELIARGFSGPEVAEQIAITVKTVDTYRHRINEKVGVHHRSEYVQLALDAGILKR